MNQDISKVLRMTQDNSWYLDFFKSGRSQDSFDFLNLRIVLRNSHKRLLVFNTKYVLITVVEKVYFKLKSTSRAADFYFEDSSLSTPGLKGIFK